MAQINPASSLGAYIQARPWELAGESGALIFGLEKQDKTISYAVVTGAVNGYSLALCRDARALVACAALRNAQKNEADEMELISQQLDQDYIECCILEPDERALNDWLKVFGVVPDPWPEDAPVLRCHVPGMLPKPVSENEEQEMMAALMAAVDLAERIRQGKNSLFDAGQIEEGKIPCARFEKDGTFDWRTLEISGDMMIQYPAPALDDELAARRLRRLPVSGAEARVAVRRLPMPLDETAERVPTVMLLMDDQTGLIAAPMVGDYDSEYSQMAGEYLGYVEEHGRPRRILAADPRAFCLLSELAGQLSTPIERTGSAPEINDAMRGLMEYLKSTVEAQQEEDEAEEDSDVQQDVQAGLGAYLEDGHQANCQEMLPYIRERFGKNPPAGAEESYLLRVTYPEDENFWLYLAVKKDGTLRQIDQALRDIWVECCGHLSLFYIGGEVYSCNCNDLPGKSMATKLMTALNRKKVFTYAYDMGSTTELKIEILGTLKMTPRRNKVLPLARNFMPKYKCIRCGRRAEYVLRLGGEPIGDSVFCERCAETEDEFGMLPLLNSPRTGVCGYGGWFGDDDE